MVLNKKVLSKEKNPDFLCVIDISMIDGSKRDLWELSGFWGKVKDLNMPYIVWGKNRDFIENEVNVICNVKDLETYIHKNNFNAMIFIEWTQLFFDVELVNNAIQIFKSHYPDYFTQWEHCRLPVGIGVRIFSIKKMKELQTYSPQKYLDKIMNQPGNVSILHDNNKYATYEESLLDSRYSNSMQKLLENNQNDISWDLKGFRSLIKKSREKVPRYFQPLPGAKIDERKMPAAYGFESSECSEFPAYLMFDITNVCNSSCIHCPHSITYSKTGNKPVFLELDVYKKVLDECKGRKIQFIRITADGEPLLHPNLMEMIYYAAKKAVGTVGLTTNGSLLTPSKVRLLIESGLFMVDISLDAIKKTIDAAMEIGS